MTEEATWNRCDACRILFEAKTPRVDLKDGRVYHAGCWAKINKAIQPVKKGCFHHTPAEDSSKWAFAHRTWGCPDEGAVWPHGYEELAMHD